MGAKPPKIQVFWGATQNKNGRMLRRKYATCTKVLRNSFYMSKVYPHTILAPSATLRPNYMPPPAVHQIWYTSKNENFIWEYIWSIRQKPSKKFHPQLFSRENIFEKFWVYRSLNIHLKWNFFKNVFVRINVEGQKFLFGIDANFQFLLFLVVTAKTIYRIF